MAQIEVYQWLEKKRLEGCDDYFSPKEVAKGLDDIGIHEYGKHFGVSHDLNRLSSFGYLEVLIAQSKTNVHRVFRLKKSYLKNKKMIEGIK